MTYQALTLLTTTTTHQHQLFPLPPQTYNNYATTLYENESSYYCGMTVTLSDAESLEIETRELSTNKTWHHVRSQHLTSSVLKRISSGIADVNRLAASIQRPKRLVQTGAMNRGLEMEPIAVAQHEQVTLLLYRKSSCTPCRCLTRSHGGSTVLDFFRGFWR